MVGFLSTEAVHIDIIAGFEVSCHPNDSVKHNL